MPEAQLETSQPDTDSIEPDTSIASLRKESGESSVYSEVPTQADWIDVLRESTENPGTGPDDFEGFCAIARSYGPEELVNLAPVLEQSLPDVLDEIQSAQQSEDADWQEHDDGTNRFDSSRFHFSSALLLLHMARCPHNLTSLRGLVGSVLECLEKECSLAATEETPMYCIICMLSQCYVEILNQCSKHDMDLPEPPTKWPTVPGLGAKVGEVSCRAALAAEHLAQARHIYQESGGL
jgi:hypothetical protein